MNQILNVDEIKDFKDMAKKLDSDKINPILVQAQDIELRSYLGTTFYFDVMANLSSEDYQDLIFGGSFEIENQRPQVTYYQEGLKSLLADLFYARYILQINTNITPFGATTKRTNDGEASDRAELKDIAQAHREMAASKWEMIKMYLDEKYRDFPAYNATVLQTQGTSERRFRFKRL